MADVIADVSTFLKHQKAARNMSEHAAELLKLAAARPTSFMGCDIHVIISQMDAPTPLLAL